MTLLETIFSNGSGLVLWMWHNPAEAILIGAMLCFLGVMAAQVL